MKQKKIKTKYQIQNFQRGFTLIELLLYVGVSFFLLLIISFFLSMLLEARIKNQTIAEVEQQGLYVMQMIAQTTRNSETIILPSQGASASSLTLDVVNDINDPTVFNLSNGIAQITEGAGTVVALTNSRVIVSALNFQNLSRSSTPGTIRISFTLTHINPENRNEYNFNKTFIGSASLR